MLILPAVVAAAGAAGTSGVAALTGMDASGITHLLSLLAPAAVATLFVAAAVRPLLRAATLGQRFGAVAILAVAFALANLAALTAAMFVSRHDATLLTTLLIYSLAVSAAAALILSGTTTDAIAGLGRTAQRLGEGDLTARTTWERGTDVRDAGPELATLARTLDDMADRLQHAHQRERHAEDVRRDLIAAVSHDLRTPLASLRAMVEAVADEVVEDPVSLRRYAGEMRAAVAQISRLVDDLFEFAQLEAGAIAVETRRARVGTLVDSALAAVAHDAAQKGLRLVTDVDGAAELTCSPRIERVLHTLLINAVQHTPADGTVRLAVTSTEQCLEMEVEDTGGGIAQENLTLVFEPFFRADPARHGPGAGLGLAIARRIVEEHGGRISAESGAVGARFAVSVPL
ncbi:MAG: HAMP domain-containing sensor histidine kinase [Actinomycetes bacterium]